MTTHPDAVSDTAPMEKNHRILVVDDNENIHDDFRKILGGRAEEADFDAVEADVFGDVAATPRNVGFELSFASQGVRALELVQASRQEGRRFSLVFMDVRMPPGWDGLETSLRLWEADPDLQVVICTAYSDKSWEEMIEKLGNPERVLILKKPFDTIEVLQMAHALTEKWSLLQSSRRNVLELERTVNDRTRQLVAANTRLESETASHKAAAERVREQAVLLEKARDAILVRDLDDTILFWNHGAECLYGWTATEALGRNVLELLHDGLAAEDVSAARHALFHSGSWAGELPQKTKDGRIVIAECRWTLVRDDAGLPKSILGIHSDITEKKQLEMKFLRGQRLDSIGTLAGGMAHDLNNILQPITLAMDLLRMQLRDPSSHAMIELVSTNAKRATCLIDQVLSYVRGVEGERRPVEPETLLGDLAAIVRATFPKTIELRKRPTDLAWHFSGDSTQIHQVLLNLCVNARDAMPSGGILTLSAENAELDSHQAAALTDAAAGRYVKFTVTDTGTGIPAELHEKIFEPFFTTKETGKGTGLGLATASGIVRSHGGFITLESQEGRGTSFGVFLPYCGTAGTDAEGLPEPAVSDLSGDGELILLVDDESTILEVLRQTLEAFGFRVRIATDGEAGLRAYEEEMGEIQAVITDMMMPLMEGPGMIAGIKKLNPRAKIIATTGMAPGVSIESITRLGVEHIVAKPCEASVIMRALRDVLGPRRGDQQGRPQD